MSVGSCTSISYGAVTWPSVPVSDVVRSYEPYSEQRRSYDPTKGRKFGTLKKTGQILMSEYENARIITRDSLSSRNKLIHRYWHLTAECASTPPVCFIGTTFDRITSWTENDDFSSLSKRLAVEGKSREAFQSEVDAAVSSTQQAAFNQALNAYDFLTELGELEETFEFLGGKVKELSDLVSNFARKNANTWKRGRRRTAKSLMRDSDAALQGLGGRWMEYRYALMPIVYSIKDVQKVFEEKAYQYQSERSRKVVDLSAEFEPTTDESLFVKSEGSVIVRSLTKARFDMGEMQRLASVIGMNPFRTAWELIPLSFVVDWALNIGDAITSLTGVDYSSQRVGCTSLREVSKFTYVHKDRYTYSFTEGGKLVNICGQTIPLASNAYDLNWLNVVREVETDSYLRFLWNRPAPRVIFDPYLDWKRMIDSFVLLYQPTKKILRSLK